MNETMLEKINNENTIILIGRAHSGTRILPESLINSGVFMGSPLNVANDLLPEHSLYEACRICGSFVDYHGNYDWNFEKVVHVEIPNEFKELLIHYLSSILHSTESKVGWKIPENTLIYPWLIRLLPHAKFIHWVRHPEGNCSRMTGVDRLEKWNIPCAKFLFHDWNYKMRYLSWKYHYDIVMNTPRPKNYFCIRYEDYILRQDKTKKELEDYIGITLSDIEVHPQRIRIKDKKLMMKYPFLKKAMQELQYD